MAAGIREATQPTFGGDRGVRYPYDLRIRLIKHEAVPGCGSFEVRFADGRVSQYFYFEELPGRRLRSDLLTRDEALEQAKALARDEQEKEG